MGIGNLAVVLVDNANCCPYGRANVGDGEPLGLARLRIGVGLVAGGVAEDFLKNDIATTPSHYYDVANYGLLEDALEDIVNP